MSRKGECKGCKPIKTVALESWYNTMREDIGILPNELPEVDRWFNKFEGEVIKHNVPTGMEAPLAIRFFDNLSSIAVVVTLDETQQEDYNSIKMAVFEELETITSLARKVDEWKEDSMEEFIPHFEGFFNMEMKCFQDLAMAFLLLKMAEETRGETTRSSSSRPINEVPHQRWRNLFLNATKRSSETQWDFLIRIKTLLDDIYDVMKLVPQVDQAKYFVMFALLLYMNRETRRHILQKSYDQTMDVWELVSFAGKLVNNQADHREYHREDTFEMVDRHPEESWTTFADRLIKLFDDFFGNTDFIEKSNKIENTFLLLKLDEEKRAIETFLDSNTGTKVSNERLQEPKGVVRKGLQGGHKTKMASPQVKQTSEKQAQTLANRAPCCSAGNLAPNEVLASGIGTSPSRLENCESEQNLSDPELESNVSLMSFLEARKDEEESLEEFKTRICKLFTHFCDTLERVGLNRESKIDFIAKLYLLLKMDRKSRDYALKESSAHRKLSTKKLAQLAENFEKKHLQRDKRCWDVSSPSPSSAGKTGLKIYYHNCRSVLRKKKGSLKELLRKRLYDIIMLTETCFNDSVDNDELSDDDYYSHCYRKDRNLAATKKSKYGGVLALINKNHKCGEVKIDLATEQLKKIESVLEFVSFDLLLSEHFYFRFVVIYIPPDKVTLEGSDVLCGLLETLITPKDISRSQGVMVVGDFNMPDLESSLNPIYNPQRAHTIVGKVIKVVQKYKLKQYCKVKTNYKNYLDVVFSNKICEVHEAGRSPIESDHKPLDIFWCEE